MSRWTWALVALLWPLVMWRAESERRRERRPHDHTDFLRPGSIGGRDS